MSNPTVIKSMFSFSNRLLAMAWSIEIIAASVGLFLALSRMIGPDGRDSPSLFMGIQGALPFFGVAIIELTKIPLASIFYTTKTFMWKTLFLTSLLLAMVITFETFFIGFEQYQSLIMRDLRGVNTKIAEKQRIIRGADAEKSNSANFLKNKDGELANYNKIIINIRNRFDKNEDGFRNEIDQIKSKYLGSGAPIKSRINSIENQIEELQKNLERDRKRTNSERSEALNIAKNSVENRTQVETEQLAKLEVGKDKVRQNADTRRKDAQNVYENESKTCFLFGCVETRTRRDVKIREIDLNEKRQLDDLSREEKTIQRRMRQSPTGEFSAITDEFEQKFKDAEAKYQSGRDILLEKKGSLERELAEKTGRINQVDQQKISRINQKITSNNDERNAALASQKKRFDELQDRFSKRSKNVDASDAQSAEAANLLISLCTTLNDKVADNQIYRLAMQLHGADDACELTQEQLSVTKVIWFGSLALVVSALGTVLALAAFVARAPTEHFNGGGRPLGKRLRMAFVAIRRKMHKARTVIERVEVEKIVEVTREVPVDRVAITEIPIEVVRKEIIHVPVYTDDPALIGKPFEKS